MSKWVPLLKMVLAASLAVLVAVVALNLIFGTPMSAVSMMPGIVGGLLAYWFISTSKWGDVKCPNCGTQQPTWRKPTSFRQAMWGGYTCANCGTEIDRKGQALSGPKVTG